MAEEIADVQIMIEQITQALDLGSVIALETNNKLRRLEDLLKG